jgi:hypothetical protein
MSTGNPLEQLRRRTQSHATPTAFVALAEEHRRAGRFGEAIAVCRDGLERYPAYVSARVTLGRALLDSGEVATAVAELDHAVAQSPDNLAAARALEAAHAALGDMPPDAPASPAMQDDASSPDLFLHEAGGDVPSLHGSLVEQAFAVGADGPQEFGLGPDWSIPDASLSLPTALDAPVSASPGDDAAGKEAYVAHAESPNLYFTPAHPQGEEPAGIWPVPSEAAGTPPDAVEDGARVAEIEDPVALDLAGAEPPSLESDPLPPFGTGFEVDDVAEVALSGTPDAAVSADEGALAASDVPPLADNRGSSPSWGAFFGGEAAADAPATFAGWGEDVLPTTEGADRAPWSADGAPEQAAAWTVPDGPSATWALGDLHEASGADPTPFQATLQDDHASVATTFASPEPLVATSLPAATSIAWAGSVKSALGEVFALAGHGASLEPPVHASPAVREAMADAAVEAAREDPTLRPDDEPPTLASLQQMLDAVRARRAALFSNVEP